MGWKGEQKGRGRIESLQVPYSVCQPMGDKLFEVTGISERLVNWLPEPLPWASLVVWMGKNLPAR